LAIKGFPHDKNIFFLDIEVTLIMTATAKYHFLNAFKFFLAILDLSNVKSRVRAHVWFGVA